MDVKIYRLDRSERGRFIELIKLFQRVFGLKNFKLPANSHLDKILSKPGFMVLVALKDQQVVGGLTAYVLDQYYSSKPLAYIFDLAVDQTFQRNGIGKELITSFNNCCRELGFEAVFVQADKIDGYVVDFYRSTGPSEEEQVIHFDYNL